MKESDKRKIVDKAEPMRRLSLDLPATLYRDFRIHCINHDTKMAAVLRDLIVKELTLKKPKATAKAAVLEQGLEQASESVTQLEPEKPVRPPFGAYQPGSSLRDYLRLVIDWMDDEKLQTAVFAVELFSGQSRAAIRESLAELRANENLICGLAVETFDSVRLTRREAE